MFRWIMKLNVLRVPLDHICNGIIRRLRYKDLPKVSESCVGKVNNLLSEWNRRFECW